MEFGITFKGFVEAERARYLVKAAEYAGFSYCWFYDSHILWRDCYAAIAMCMEHTKTMRFGPLVTNPDVRDWSVAASIFGSLSKQSERPSSARWSSGRSGPMPKPHQAPQPSPTDWGDRVSAPLSGPGRCASRPSGAR